MLLSDKHVSKTTYCVTAEQATEKKAVKKDLAVRETTGLSAKVIRRKRINIFSYSKRSLNS